MHLALDTVRRLKVASLFCLGITAIPALADCVHFEGYVINGDGTFLDPRTSLVWRTCPVGQTWVSGTCSGKLAKANLVDALEIAHSMRFAGSTAWRIPTPDEFRQIFDSGCDRPVTSPAIAKADKDGKYGAFWTFDVVADVWKATTANFSSGTIYTFHRDDENGVLLVRGGPAEAGRSFASFLSSSIFKDGALASKARTLDLYRSRYEDVASKNADLQAMYDELQSFIDQYQGNDPDHLVDRAKAKQAEIKARITSRNKAAALYDEARKLESALRCQEALRTDVQAQALDGVQHSTLEKRSGYRISYDGCIDNQTFASMKRSNDPQSMYIAAGKYDHKGQTYRAEELYSEIASRFPRSTWAAKAVDQLSSIKRSDEADRRSQQMRESIARSAQESRDVTNQANRDSANRAYNQCRIEMDSCYSRGGSSCYRDCNSLLR
jgi:hypothetical protein